VKSFRLATYNVALNRPRAGDLLKELDAVLGAQMSALLSIIREIDADVWVINELDYDSEQQALNRFQALLNKAGLHFPYVYTAPVNTGVPSGRDLVKQDPMNPVPSPLGFGDFPGQYGMAVLSVFPLRADLCRTFQYFLWRDMPDALLPRNPDGSAFYSDEDLAVLRLSSKSHWDLPVELPTGLCHLLVSHPTPPAFDGVERRNACRNHDEIRFWVDYISSQGYMVDDKGVSGGLAGDAAFVIAGDLNASIAGGDSQSGAIARLLTHERLTDPKPTSDRGHDLTARWKLRADYLLPAKTLPVLKSQVFWPNEKEPLFHETEIASDHRPVWMDLGV
jgi:endonuclease/exonuclease/phosphatase family metal-dependent hydrolase